MFLIKCGHKNDQLYCSNIIIVIKFPHNSMKNEIENNVH